MRRARHSVDVDLVVSDRIRAQVRDLVGRPKDSLRAKQAQERDLDTLVYDFESKDVPRNPDGSLRASVEVQTAAGNLVLITDEYGRNQKEGFCRAFQVGTFDGRRYLEFRNDPDRLDELARCEPEDRAVQPGGCADRFLRHVFGNDPAYRSDRAAWYGHNAGNFDTTFVLAWLILHKEEFGSRIASVHGRIQQIVVWRRGSGFDPDARRRRDWLSWTFRDSALLLPMSLEEAAKTFNPDGDQKVKGFDRHMHEDDPRWRTYNAADCRSLYGALQAFAKMLRGLGGELGMTAPATSMRLFRNRFLQDPIYAHRHFPDCDGTCRRGRGDASPTGPEARETTQHGAPPQTPPKPTEQFGRQGPPSPLGRGCAPEPKGCNRGRRCDGKCHGCLHDWIRKGYFGGRTEIHHRFAPVGTYYFDINSSYAASMLEAMPVGDGKVVLGREAFEELREGLSKTHVGFVECLVWIPETCTVPPLPRIRDGKLRFETGFVRGVFEYDELCLIFDPHVGGHIVEVEKSVWYRKKVIFKEFVETLYAFRKEYERSEDAAAAVDGYARKAGWSQALSELAKLLMNSLYGKFAMDEEREELVLVDPGNREAWPDGKPIDGQHFTCPVWKIPRYISPKYVIPQISARITALSRKRLWLAMRDVVYPPRGSKREPGSIYYLDTDSLMVSVDMGAYASEFDVAGKYDYKLGAWKREYVGMVLRVESLQPKTYAVELFDEQTREKIKDHPKYKDGDVVRMKGVQRSASTRANFDKLRGDGEWGDARPRQGGEVHFERVSKHRTVIRKRWKSPRMVPAFKSIQSRYDKRVMMPDGSTRPHHCLVP